MINHKRGIRYHVYADDTQLYVDFPSNDAAFAIDRIRRCVIDVKAWLALRCLLLNEAILIAALNRREQPSPLQIDICGSDVRTSANIRDLGVYLLSSGESWGLGALGPAILWGPLQGCDSMFPSCGSGKHIWQQYIEKWLKIR